MKSTKVLAWIGAALQLGQKSHFYAKALCQQWSFPGKVRKCWDYERENSRVRHNTFYFADYAFISNSEQRCFFRVDQPRNLVEISISIAKFLLQMVGFNWTNNPALSLMLLVGSCNDQHQHFDHYDQCVWTLDSATWCWWEDSMPLCQSRSGAWEPLSVGNLCTF